VTHFESNRAGLKLIVAYKLIKAALGWVLTGVLLHEHLHHRIATVAERVAAWFANLGELGGVGVAISEWISREVTGRNIELAIGLVALDALSTSLEGVGLHYRQRWAAWLVVVATSFLIPFEAWGFIHKHTALRASILVINLAILVYLVRRVLMQHRNASAA